MGESRCFVHPGQAEVTKGAMHGAMFTLAVVFSVYNGCAWYLRGERHLAVNTGMYGALTVWEVYQVFRHLDTTRKGVPRA